MVIMEKYLFSLLLLSTIVSAADEKEEEVSLWKYPKKESVAGEKEQEFSPFHRTIEHDRYRNLLLAKNELNDRFVWVIRDLTSGNISIKGLICPTDNPQDSIDYTPSDQIVRSLIKKIDAHELKMAVEEQLNEEKDDARDMHVNYDWYDNSITVYETFTTPRYFRYIKAVQDLDESDNMIVSGSISWLETAKTDFFEPSEQKCIMLRDKIDDFLKNSCVIARNADGKVQQITTIKRHFAGDLLKTESANHAPRALSWRERFIEDRNANRVYQERRVYYDDGDSDYVEYNPPHLPASFLINMPFENSCNDIYYDRILDAVIAKSKFAGSEWIRVVKGIQKMEKGSELKVSGFRYFFKDMRVAHFDLSDDETVMLKTRIGDFLKNFTITHDGQGKLKKMVYENVWHEDDQIISDRTKYRPRSCAIRSKLVKDVHTGGCTISGMAHSPDEIFTFAYVPSEKDIKILEANMKKKIIKQNEPLENLIDRGCQAYLDDYLENVVEMAQIVDGNDGYRIVKGGDDCCVDLNSDEIKDGSVEVVLSFLKNYIDLKKEADVHFSTEQSMQSGPEKSENPLLARFFGSLQK